MQANDITMLRKAALTLHALPAKDMRKVWERLDESERVALSPLLDELSSLGIPNGRPWVDSDGVLPDGDAAQADPRMAIRAWGSAQALAALTTQSVDTVATVMRIESWPWQAEVLDAWPAEQRHALRTRLEAAACNVPPRLAEALLRRMALAGAQARRTAASSSRPSSSSAHRRWYHGVMSLFMLT